MTEPAEPIAVIEKNHRERVHVDLSEFKGKNYADVRVYFDSGEQWKPTQKGVAVALSKLPALIQALHEVDRLARERGLLTDGDETLAA